MSWIHSLSNKDHLSNGWFEKSKIPTKKLWEKVKQVLSPEYLRIDNLLKWSDFTEWTSEYWTTEIIRVKGEWLQIALYDYDVVMVMDFAWNLRIEKLVSTGWSKKSLREFDINKLLSTFDDKGPKNTIN